MFFNSTNIRLFEFNAQKPGNHFYPDLVYYPLRMEEEFFGSSAFALPFISELDVVIDAAERCVGSPILFASKKLNVARDSSFNTTNTLPKKKMQKNATKFLVLKAYQFIGILAFMN